MKKPDLAFYYPFPSTQIVDKKSLNTLKDIFDHYLSFKIFRDL